MVIRLDLGEGLGIVDQADRPDNTVGEAQVPVDTVTAVVWAHARADFGHLRWRRQLTRP